MAGRTLKVVVKDSPPQVIQSNAALGMAEKTFAGGMKVITM